MGNAGAPIGQEARPTYQAYRDSLRGGVANNVYHPFSHQVAWDIADWAKDRGPTSTAVTDLLSIKTVVDKLDLPYKSSKELNAIIDNQLPSRPAFKRQRIEVHGETFEFYHRDPLECIKALYGDPTFAPHLAFAPQRHYEDEDQTIRIYNEMHTGKWWWRTQSAVEAREPGGTIIPVLISTDKTQITLFRNKSAYPIYMTIGNIPKDIRRKPSRGAQILIGYLPTSRLTHIKNKDTRRRALANVYHACIGMIFAPLEEAGLHGIPLASGDGVIRRCHPILAAFVGDYPEQCLVVGCKNMECPQACILDKDELGDYSTFEDRNYDDIIEALQTIDDGPLEYIAACEEVGIKPIFHPFWENLPYCNIYQSITPDVLHQLYQGMVKHLIQWIKKAYGAEEIDARFARLPPNHNLRHFSNGISILSRVSGQEHKDICRVLLGVILDLPLPVPGMNPTRLVLAARGLMDYLYMAQYPSHSTTTLEYLDEALAKFHENKEIFIELGIRLNFNLPKLHSLLHFSPKIKLFGTTDNYSTEYSERLHIDFTKDAYRATNHKDEYPQMTLWLQRREKMHQHALFIKWRLAGEPPIHHAAPPMGPRRFRMQIARFPTDKSVTFDDASRFYGAKHLKLLMSEYIVRHNNPDYTPAQVKQVAAQYTLPFCSVAAFHRVKFWHPDAQGRDNIPEVLDVIHARPGYVDTQKRKQPGRFDTALIEERPEEEDEDRRGIQGCRVGQVRMVFSLSLRANEAAFRDPKSSPTHFAYVEWFSRFAPSAEPNHDMYKVSRAFARGGDVRLASIIPVVKLRRSVHLIPKFGPEAPREWTMANVLELCKHFYLNPFTDRHAYITMY
ncbi:hypothetical protein BV25DRAFT_1869164 [Artomyces pyxidatus]|uniref:Uncharacterized protein n=1 Tax=Artomyces pyxidatus TaxID=48021 RepID=A0ACB8T945_9AGAM|nr:hypothetical protein BV25DRAFT_1869164 [Artomyces pyxidatus]